MADACRACCGLVAERDRIHSKRAPTATTGGCGLVAERDRTFRNHDEHPKEAFIYHAAGFAGESDASYIDSVILRDRNTGTAWTSQATATLNERRYYVQNWRADVVAITKDDGQPVEFIRYTSYGTAQAFAAADVNRDGAVNSQDASDWAELYADSGLGNAAVPVEFDFDGSSFDPDDEAAFTVAYNEASGWTNAGANGARLSRMGNRKGYAGYEYDQAIVSYHVRHRVYVPEIARWTRRDPLGYVDGVTFPRLPYHILSESCCHGLLLV